MTPTNSKTLVIRSEDDWEFPIDKLTAISRITLIGEMLEALGEREDGETTTIPIKNVTGRTLKIILKWAIKHKDDPIEASRNEPKGDVPIGPWDKKFCEANEKVICELLSAANYLQMYDMFDLLTKFVADSTEGKTDRELKRVFKIEENYVVELDTIMDSTEGKTDRELKRMFKIEENYVVGLDTIMDSTEGKTDRELKRMFKIEENYVVGLDTIMDSTEGKTDGELKRMFKKDENYVVGLETIMDTISIGVILFFVLSLLMISVLLLGNFGRG